MLAHKVLPWVLFLLVLSLTAIPGYAATYTCPLPWAAGDYAGNTVSGTFNFGRTFTHTDSIRTRWSGQMIAGIAVWDIPGDYQEFGFENYFTAAVSGHMPSSTAYWGRNATIQGEGYIGYPRTRQFDTLSSFGNDWYDANRTWDCAISGKGNVQFYVQQVWGFSEQPTTLIQGTTRVDHAELVLEGTAVPEPSGILALAGGLGMLLPVLRRPRIRACMRDSRR